jgi:hypothetical protein
MDLATCLSLVRDHGAVRAITIIGAAWIEIIDGMSAT